jgi:type IV secretory pathway TraG/TraD family ATPase VirD4
VNRRHETTTEPPHLLFGGHLMDFALTLVVGLVAGALAMQALRVAKLRWTWALCGVPVAYLACLIHWRAAVATVLATLVAAGWGAYWHWEDLERGGEQAREARDRLGPFRWAWSRWQGQRAREARIEDGKLALGTIRRGGICRVPAGLDRGVHAFVIGATGAGKTVTQAAIAQAHIFAGLPAIVLDPKGDRYLRAVLGDAAERSGQRFIEWSPSGPTVYNPFGRGGPTEITDKALAGHRWSEPHYELATQRLLGHVLTTMRAAGQWPPTLSKIVNFMDPERLDVLASEVGGEIGQRVRGYVDGISARGRADLGGGRDRLAVLVEGELGPWLDPTIGSGPEFGFADSLKQGAVVYMHIDADRYPAASKLLGAALVIDLVTLTADLHDRDLRGLVVIDEFAALAAEQVHRLFGRARSAGISVLLGTQSLADLRSARPDDPSDTLTEQVLTNIEFAVIHRESDPDSAERLARVAGTKQSWSTTRRVSGMPGMGGVREGTRTPEREFWVAPDEFKRLNIGEAVVIRPTAKQPAEIVQVLPPGPGTHQGG